MDEVLFCWHCHAKIALHSVLVCTNQEVYQYPASAENGLRAELEPGFIRKAWGVKKKNTHTHTVFQRDAVEILGMHSNARVRLFVKQALHPGAFQAAHL